MIQFTINGDARAALRVTALVDRQLPFATAKALNDTAIDAQENIRGGLFARFHLRRETFILRTVKIFPGEFATKDNPRAILRIDPTRDLLAKFERGGTKRPRYTRNIAVPRDARADVAQVIPKRLRPKSLQLQTVRTATGKTQVKGRSRTFLIRTESFEGIFQRVRGGGMRLLYGLERSVQIPASLEFERTARLVAARTWEIHLNRALVYAISTAK